MTHTHTHTYTHTHIHTPINRLWSPLAYGLGGNNRLWSPLAYGLGAIIPDEWSPCTSCHGRIQTSMKAAILALCTEWVAGWHVRLRVTWWMCIGPLIGCTTETEDHARPTKGLVITVYCLFTYLIIMVHMYIYTDILSHACVAVEKKKNWA